MALVHTVSAMKSTRVSQCPDADLVRELTRLAGVEREATVAFLVHLAEFDARRLYAGAGFTSTFRYCVEELHLSEDAACNRIEAARAARASPVILDMLTAGTLSPTTARMLRPHLTRENHSELLAIASGKSRQQLERMLAERFPQPDVFASIRKLPAPSPASAPALETIAVSRIAVSPRIAASPVAPPGPRPVVKPLSAERFEVRFTVTEETRRKLRECQDLLGHAVPSGDLAQVFDRALTLLVEDLRKRKAGVTDRARASRGRTGGSRNIPAAVRRGVWERDKGRCAFVASSGRRCGETRRVEFHHDRVPYGVGGKSTLDNISLRCHTHNRYEAEQFYGPGRAYGGVGISDPSQDG
jgi:hypothetical protein